MTVGQQDRISVELKYAIFLGVVTWLFHKNIGRLIWSGSLASLPFKLLNLPLATFWLLAPSTFRLDYWYGWHVETVLPGAFYSHMFSATIAYWCLLKSPTVFSACRRLFFPRRELPIPAPTPLQKAGTLRTYLDSGHRIAMALLLTCSVWYIHENELGTRWYLLLRDLASFVNFPVALVGLLLPQELRGLHVWFFNPDMSGIEMSRTTLGIHLVLGIPTYYLILTGYSWLRRRRDRIEGQSEAPPAG